MHKLSSALIIMVILTASILLLNEPVNSLNSSFYEKMDIYSYGSVSLIDLKIYNHPTITDNINKVLDFLNGGSVEIYYSNIPYWSSNFNYLISGMVFEKTPLKKIPSSEMEITLGTNISNKSIIDDMDNLFKTYYFAEKNTLVGNTDYKIFISVLKRIIPSNKYTRFLQWVDPLSFSTDMSFIIIVSKNSTGSMLRILVFKDLKSKYYEWILDRIVSYKAKAQDIGYNYTSIIDIHFKNVFIESTPSNITLVKEDNLKRIYTYRFKALSSMSFPDLKFRIRYETPVLLIERSFNSTMFKVGDNIEVKLTIKNQMPYSLNNINISEYKWWEGIGKLVEGNTSASISNLKEGSEYTITYVIKISSPLSQPIFIGPAKAVLTSVTGLKEILYSNTNIVYLNYDNPPFIEASITSVSVNNLSFGKSISYEGQIVNKGKSMVHSVIFGEYVIGDLKPGETRKIEIKRSTINLKSDFLVLSLNCTYIFNGTEYNVSTEKIPLHLYPQQYNGPWLNLDYTTLSTNNTLKYSIKISNKGLYEVKNILVKIIPYKFSYINGSFSKNLYFRKEFVPVNSSVTLNASFNIASNTISIYPRIILYFSESPSNISTGVKYFYNNILTKLNLPVQPYLYERNYTFTLVFDNRGPAEIYNLSISLQKPAFNITPTNINYSIIPAFSSKRFSFILFSNRTGNFTFPEIKCEFWYLGYSRETLISGGNVTFYRGIWISYKLPKSINEDQKFNITFIIYTDSPKYISNAYLNITLPPGLRFTDNTNSKVVPINIIGKKNEVKLEISPSKPGEYKLAKVTVKYNFNNITAKFTAQSSELPVIKIKENIFKRYWLYFIPMLIVVIIYSYYLKRKLVK